MQGGELAAQGAEICLGALDVRLQIFQALEQIDGVGPGQVHGLHGVVQDHIDGIHHLFGGGVGSSEQIVQGTNGDLALVDRTVPGRQESLDALVQVVGGAGEALKNVQGIRNFAQAPVPLPQAVQDPVSQAATVVVPVVRKGVQARHKRLGHFLQKALIDLLLDGGDALVGDFRGDGIFLLVDIILDGGAVNVALQDAHHILAEILGDDDGGVVVPSLDALQGVVAVHELPADLVVAF